MNAFCMVLDVVKDRNWLTQIPDRLVVPAGMAIYFFDRTWTGRSYRLHSDWCYAKVISTFVTP
jgi:hypothetical protein